MKFLINRSDAIGDSILTMPMAKLLKETYPDCHITFLVSARSADVFENHPYIDEFKVYHRKSRFYFKIKEIFSIFNDVKPTHYFYVGGGYLPNFVAWLKLVKFRGGLKSRWHTYLFLNHGVRQKRSMVSMHEMEFNLNLLAPLGIKYLAKNKSNYLPAIALKESEEDAAYQIFLNELNKNNLPTDRNNIFIHPGMTGHTLNWSPRNYGRLIVKLNQKFPGKFLFVVSYTPSDDKYVQGVKDILGREENLILRENTYFFNGAIHGLRNFMSVLKKASLFVGPSTGTTHLAAVLGVPVVGIYSPIKVQSALRWGPIGEKTDKIRIVVPDVICGEVKQCALKACPYYECMGKIEVDEIVKNAIAIMDL